MYLEMFPVVSSLFTTDFASRPGILKAILHSKDVRYPEAARNACMDPEASPKNIVELFKPAIKAAKAHGSLAIMQITHAG